MITWYGHLLGQGSSGVLVVPSYTASFGDFVPVDASAGLFQVLLPAIIASAKGKRIIVMNSSTSSTAISIVPNGSDTINGVAASISIISSRTKTDLSSRTFWCDGVSNWYAYS